MTRRWRAYSAIAGVLFVPPAYLVRANVSLGALVECHGMGGRQFGGGSPPRLLLLPVCDRVVRPSLRCGVHRSLSSGHRQDPLSSSRQSHFARFAIEHEAKRPALRAATADTEIKTSAIGIETRFARARDRQCGQPLDFLCAITLVSSRGCAGNTPRCPPNRCVSSKDTCPLTGIPEVSAQSHEISHKSRPNSGG